jgi:hypothetical protein
MPARLCGLAGVALWFFACPALAQSDLAECELPEADSERAGLFPALEAEALRLDRDTCRHLARNSSDRLGPDLSRRYREFAIYARKLATEAFNDLPVENLDEPFDDFVEKLSRRRLASSGLPELSVVPVDSPEAWLSFHFDDRARAGRIVSRDDDAACVPRLGISCSDALDDLATALNAYKTAIERRSASRSVEALGEGSREWTAFVAEARSQTPLDLRLTAALERRHLESGFLVGPPKRQWSVLRPGLVIERMADAAPGERNELGIAVEWFGVNWWSAESPLFGIPFGVSLTSVYSDRHDGADAGHGLALHFGNNYLIGWSQRDRSETVFFSIDLLKLVADRQRRLDRYRERVERFRRRRGASGE